ncbi:hypothetical protein NADFUDRAFT_21086 [Nadsonia fulvescens var. elongata DSM 6958]|uniref:Dynein heavy chain, cytoplasmic n=1 Tax=Nadsonia fulvescens var. elongata DSM 6958 TaxID=857566 RepID=A0A1E3PPY0_9ASCO|nr:hypothetical protein NADFUDRAFT_21086 [Nadsonia fulvescens var. elongata DSM 6958]
MIDCAPHIFLSYSIDTVLQPRPTTIATLQIIKGQSPLLSTVPITSQLQVITLPAQTRGEQNSAGTNDNVKGPFDALHSVIHLGVKPFFEAFSKVSLAQQGQISSMADGLNLPGTLGNDNNKNIMGARRKIADLENSFLNLKQNNEIPPLYLTFHPVVENAMAKAHELNVQPSISLIPENLLQDTTTLNSVHSIVNGWVKSIQNITKVSRDPSNGSASQEINFWLSKESTLKSIDEQLGGEGVSLTLEILSNAKRFHATVSFLSDTGLKNAMVIVQSYNQFIKDFPLDCLISASNLAKLKEGIVKIFNHINKKLRITTYPVERCLPLVESISDDLNNKVKGLLENMSLMYIDFDEFKKIMIRIREIFSVWEEQVKEFVHVCREVTRKRSEKYIKISVNSRHSKIKERLAYIYEFRSRHEQLHKTIIKVLARTSYNNPISFINSSTIPKISNEANPVDDLRQAYDFLRSIDILDTSPEGIASWTNAERFYSERTSNVEQTIIIMLREKLASAKTSNEMFRVFSKFNALFIRPAIRGAVQEYQTILIENVKNDIIALQRTFRQQFGNTEAYEMSKLRDIPPISGAIIWIKRIEKQLDIYLTRVEDVFGAGWELYADGQKLQMEIQSFKKKLDTKPIFEAWLSTVSKKSVCFEGFLFRFNRYNRTASTGKGSVQVYDISVNFDPNAITIFKEVRNLSWLNYQVPFAINSLSITAKTIYPYAVSLIDTLQTLEQTQSAIADLSIWSSALLSVYQNSVLNHLAEGIHLKWEVFSLSSNPKSLLSVGNEDQHFTFVHRSQEKVLTLQKKAGKLLELDMKFLELIEDLKVCSYSLDSFSVIIADLQKIVEGLVSEEFSNIIPFCEQLNKRIEEVLTIRAKEMLSEWRAYTENPVEALELSFELPIQTHEIILKNQTIQLSTPLALSEVNYYRSLQRVITSISLVPLINPFKFNIGFTLTQDNQFTKATFSYILRNLKDDYTETVYLIDSHIEKAEKYLDKWYRFQSLWDLKVDFVRQSLGIDLNKWLLVLNEISRARSLFDITESSKLISIINIDFRQVQSRINTKYDIWQHDIISLFSELLSTRMKETCSEISHMRSELELQVLDAISTLKAVKIVTAVEKCRASLIEWDSEISLFIQGEKFLSRQRFQFPSDWLFIDQIENEMAALKEIFLKRNTSIEEQTDVLRSRIEAEIYRMSESVKKVKSTWSEEKPLSGLLRPKDVAATLSLFESQVSQLVTENELLLKASKIIAIKFVGFPCLKSLMEEIEDLKSVWASLDSIWHSLDDLRDTPWLTVVIRKIRQSLDKLISMSKNMPTRIRQYTAFEFVLNVLKQLLVAMPIISSLKSEALHERHWNRLIKIIGTSRREFSNSMTLGDVWDLELNKNEGIIKEIVAQANGELVLEEYLKEVRYTWNSYSLELVNYQNKCRLIKGWDLIFQTCSEHLNSLAAMHHSPYFKVFDEDILAWEDKLTRVHVLFDSWIDVQRQWVYLEGVFDSNTDIKHILPVESTRFQNINSELFVILRKVYKSPLILDVVNIPDIQRSIERLLDLLGKIQKALGNYLEKIRQTFARFYFVGDEDLLEIIGNLNNIQVVERHLRKMFSGIAGFIYDAENTSVVGIKSKDNEVVNFNTPLMLNHSQKVANWLIDLDEQVKLTLSDSLPVAIMSYTEILSDGKISQDNLLSWVKRNPAQINDLSTQIYWTKSIEDAFESNGSLLQVENKVIAVLEHLANIVLKEEISLNRRKCESLITSLVHQREILASLKLNCTNGSASFSWTSQMRFYYNYDAKPLDRLVIKQANATFKYGFEYLGVQDKLIITPLVDKCFLTMTQALNQGLGGSPFGPAGTGKTESIKALGQQLGKFVLVFCCDESFNFQALGRILLGLCQVGAWGCFDEFNRLDENMLSAVSSLIEKIELALKTQRGEQRSKIELMGKTIDLNLSTGIFVTMNPGYAGRSSLPGNLKKLFRSFAMTKPDKELIAEVILYSQGFINARLISNKLVPYFDLLSRELSDQVHYDFGLRALKSVLLSCGRLKRRRLQQIRNTGDEDTCIRYEYEIVIQSLRETIWPKLIEEDSIKFIHFEGQCFEGIEYQSANQEKLFNSIKIISQKQGFTPSKPWVRKIMQLSQISEIHHGIMLVGSSGSGKSSVLETLLSSLDLIEEIKNIRYVIDAKVMSKESLYGTLDSTTGEWIDGLFTGILRKVSENLRGESLNRHWFIFDGDVDPEWVENLNSVLDDNKILTLPNGERLPLPSNSRLVFEVENLNFATPATVSRCGMIWFESTVVTSDMYISFYLNDFAKIHFDELEDNLIMGTGLDIKVQDLLSEFISVIREVLKPELISQVASRAEKMNHIMGFSNPRAIKTFFTLLGSSCFKLFSNISKTDFPLDKIQRRAFLFKSLILALIWAYGGDCIPSERHKFGQFINEISTFSLISLPDITRSLIDYEVSLSSCEWVLYNDRVQTVELDTHAIIDTDIIIPTVDTVRHEDLIYSLLNQHKSFILCGPPGSGKTMMLFGALRKAPNIDVVGLNFSSNTTPELLIKTLEQYCEYKKNLQGITLSPPQIGRWLVLFCDEINLPDMDTYGTQRVISFMRQLIEKSGFWRTSDKQWVTISRVQFAGACNPPTDTGRSELSNRFLRHVSTIMVDYPEKESLQQIYETFMVAVLKTVPSLRNFAKQMTEAMVDFYTETCKKFNTVMQPHYVYSPRELTRWCRGIYESIVQLDTLGYEDLIRIWAHEAYRLFNDRLVYADEKKWSEDMLSNIAQCHFMNADLSIALSKPILYSNWLTKNYLPIEKDVLRSFIDARMRVFCEEELDTPLVLFDEVLDHVLRIDRVMRQPQGHMILIGVSGYGKTTLSRFVAWINGLKVFQLKIHGKYSSEDFDNDLRKILRLAGCEGEKICFILGEDNIISPVFLERMNTLLANAEIPGLFEGDDYASLMNACKEGAQRNDLILDTDDELYKWFTQQVVKNLHVIFTMNPPGEDFSTTVATSPALFNRCVINWMGDWSEKSLYQVGKELTKNLDLDISSYNAPNPDNIIEGLGNLDTYRDSINCVMVRMHTTLQNIHFQSGARKNPTTPGDFLDFVKHFRRSYKRKREELDDQQRHLNSGLDKLRETFLKVKELKTDLANKKIQLLAKNEEANKTLKDMISGQNEAERKREVSLQIQESLEVQETRICERQEIVKRDLKEAEPAVIDAQRSVSNIKKQHLTEVRSMINPPEAVKLTLEAVCTLLGYKVTQWREITTVIRRDDFISSIVNFSTESRMTSTLRTTMEARFLSHPSFNFESVNRASKACGPLAQWVLAQVFYSTILEKVGPLRNAVIELEEAATTTRAQAQAITDMISELEVKITCYKDDYALQISESQEIKHEIEMVETRVIRSMKLIENLATEKERWSNSIREFETRMDSLSGDCLLSSAFMAYSGCYDQYDRKLLSEAWGNHLLNFGIKFRIMTSVVEHLSNTRQRLEWHSNGLPVDDLCIENAIILKEFNRYPFIVDPTSRVSDYLVNEYSGKHFVITSFLDDSFLKHLESALRFGNPILIQDSEYFDPIINQILNKEYRHTGGRTLVRLGKQDIDFTVGFKLFLMTRDPTFKASSFVCSRTTLVNFTITNSSLKRQSLNEVMRVERPDIQEKRNGLTKLQGEYNVQLLKLEKQLLYSLSNSEGGILENDDLIATLEKLKKETTEVSVKIGESELIMRTVETIFADYEKLSIACASIFSVLENLSSLNHYYQFSLNYILAIFAVVLEKRNMLNPNLDTSSRVNFYVDSLYQEVIARTMPSLLYRDRVIFLLLLIRTYPSELDVEAFNFLFKQLEANMSTFDIISELKGLEFFSRFENLTFDDLQNFTFDAVEGLVSDFCGEIVTDLNKSLYACFLIKILLPDRFYSSVEKFCEVTLGKNYLCDNNDRFGDVIKEAGPDTPIFMCCEPGYEASFKLDLIVEARGVEYQTVSMGSYESQELAQTVIRNASRNGSWVYIQNAHYSMVWLQYLDKMIQSTKPHPDFKLFLSVEINSKAPITLLRRSRTVIFERPPGIKASMLSTFENLGDSIFLKSPIEKGRLFFLLSWLHAVIIERARFIPLSWSKNYEFNDSDFESGALVIDQWVDHVANGRSNISPTSIPWNAIKSLLVDTVYGGKIDDVDDYSSLLRLVSSIFKPEAFDDNQLLVEGDEPIKVPDGSTRKSFLLWINQLPEHESPVWLGLDSKAESNMLTMEGSLIISKVNVLLSRTRF